MDFFSRINLDFSALPHVSEWDDARKIFQGFASSKPNHWFLPAHACKELVESRNKLFLPCWQWIAHTLDEVVAPAYILLEAADS